MVLSLNPFTIRCNKEIDSAETAQVELLAGHVEKVNPDLVVRDEENPNSVRYCQVNAMLLKDVAIGV